MEALFTEIFDSKLGSVLQNRRHDSATSELSSNGPDCPARESWEVCDLQRRSRNGNKVVSLPGSHTQHADQTAYLVIDVLA